MPRIILLAGPCGVPLPRPARYNSDVHCGQRVALMGMLL